MSWSLVGVGATAVVSSGGGPSTATEPSGVAAGDLLLAIVSFRGGIAFSASADWTLLAEQLGTGSSTGPGLQLWAATRGASAPSYTFSRTGGASSSISVVAYRASSGAFSFVASTSAAPASGTSHTMTGLTTDGTNNLIVGALTTSSTTANLFTSWTATNPGTASDKTPDTSSAPTAGSWLCRVNYSNTGGTSHRHVGVDAVRALAGATGDMVAVTSSVVSVKMAAVAFKELAGGSGDTIAADEFAQYRVFEGLAGSASVTISGTHTGATSNIQARIEDLSANVIVDWTTIQTAVAAGAFSGALTVPRGGWYVAKVRKSVETAVVDAQANQWGVGVILGSFGQSHLRDSYTNGTATPSGRAVVHNGTSWALVGSAGVGQNKLTADLIAALDCPVALIETGVSGTAISYWWSAGKTTPYTTWEAKVTAAGGKLSAFRLWQGDADALAGRSKAAYKADIDAVFAQLRTDYGAGLPVIVMELGRKGGGGDTSNEAIRDAHVDAGNDAGNKSVCTIDLDQQVDQQHFTDTGHTTAGARTANVLAYLGGGSAYHRGPVAVSAVFSAAVVDVTLSHGGGTDFTPASGITGWRVLENGVAATISSAVRVSATMVRLTCAASLAGTVTVQYGYGAYPDISGWIKDNTALTLPLQTTDADIIAALIPTLSVSDAVHAHTADNLTLTLDTSLTVVESLHAHSADSLSLTIDSALIINEAIHTHTTDNFDLTSQITLAIAETLHAHTADSIAVTFDTLLAMADALHSHTVDNVVLSTSGSVNLSADNAVHNHITDNLDLTSAQALSIADALHAHAADQITLTIDSVLSLQDALHSHSVDNVNLSNAPALQIADALHLHTTDGLVLSTDIWLIVADSQHGHSADTVSLAISELLSVHSALHGHTSDNVVLFIPGEVIIDDITGMRLSSVTIVARLDGTVYSVQLHGSHLQ